MNKSPLERSLSSDLVWAIKERLEYYSKEKNDTNICWDRVASVSVRRDGVTIVKPDRNGLKKEEGWYLSLEPYNGRAKSYLENEDMEWIFAYGDHWLY